MQSTGENEESDPVEKGGAKNPAVRVDGMFRKGAGRSQKGEVTCLNG